MSGMLIKTSYWPKKQTNKQTNNRPADLVCIVVFLLNLANKKLSTY